MADPWASDPAGRAVLDEASEAMGRDVVLGCHDEAALATTEFVQPALLACDVAAFEVMRREGADDPDGVAGHSLGEFAALVAAGSMSLRDALELVVIRGLAMQRAGEEQPGGMTALLGIGSADAEQLCDQVRRDGVLVVANENSPVQVVASGSIPAIERLEALAAERKVRAVRLRIHSSVVSICASNQVLGTRRGGSDEPTPVMVACLLTATEDIGRAARWPPRSGGRDGAPGRVGRAGRGC